MYGFCLSWQLQLLVYLHVKLKYTVNEYINNLIDENEKQLR